MPRSVRRARPPRTHAPSALALSPRAWRRSARRRASATPASVATVLPPPTARPSWSEARTSTNGACRSSAAAADRSGRPEPPPAATGRGPRGRASTCRCRRRPPRRRARRRGASTSRSFSVCRFAPRRVTPGSRARRTRRGAVRSPREEAPPCRSSRRRAAPRAAPTATRRPPSGPEPGPSSRTWSAASTSRGSCSTTTTAFPASARPRRTPTSRSVSRGCSPCVGSSRT